MTELEREEDQIDRDYASGLISNAEHRKALAEMHREERYEAEDRAQQAYDDEMDNLGFGHF